MFCPSCGTQNEVGALNCLRCGSGLPRPPSATPSEPSAALPYPGPPGQSPYGGQPNYGSGPGYGGGAPAGGNVPNYMMWSIISTVVGSVGGLFMLGCFLGLPMGIVAIVFSTQVNKKLQIGDYAGAVESSNKAKQWFIISFVVSGLGLIISLIFVFLIVASRR